MRLFLAIFCILTSAAAGLARGIDTRCISMGGISIEGPIDSLRPLLKDAGFQEWGASDDGEDYFFRGSYYGIRAKLMVSVKPLTDCVEQAYITIGPYSTSRMLERNFQYFKYKIEQEYGTLTERDGAYFYIDDYGSVKLSVSANEKGSKDITVLYYTTAAFFKDAVSRGIKGDVQEIVTDNPLVEAPVERFFQDGKADNSELTNRQYDRYGYLQHADMSEQQGKSTIDYTYDDSHRLVKRTLRNEAEGITYVNEYYYNDDEEITAENQKVYNAAGQCIMTLNIRNNFLERDEQGNWTVNSLSMTYWEKGQQTQQSTALQKRTISYW